jgi:hypothetical protein
MKTHILTAAALAGFLALGAPAFANTTAPRAIAQSNAASAAPCDPAKDKPVPLGLVVRTTAIVPAVNPLDLAGAAMRGSCVGTQQYVQSSQPWLGQKHALWMWDLGSDNPMPAGASTPPDYSNF